MIGPRGCATVCSAARARPSSRRSMNTATNSSKGSSDERSREEPRAKLMRAAVLRDGRMIERDDVPEPVPGPGQVLVGVTACGVCGTDLHFAKHGDQMLKLTREMKGMPIEGGLPV